MCQNFQKERQKTILTLSHFHRKIIHSEHRSVLHKIGPVLNLDIVHAEDLMSNNKGLIT